MIGNREVVGASLRRCEADVRAVLPGCFIAETLESSDEIRCVDVAWNFHTARASSRTK
jgi:hypothetical protein